MYLIKLLLWEILGGVGRGGGRVLQDSWNNLVIFSFHLVHYVQGNGHIQSWVSRRERTSIRSSVIKHKLSLSQSLGTRAIWMTSEWAASILQNTKEAAMDAKVRGNVTRNENKCNTENQSLLLSKRNGNFVFPYLSYILLCSSTPPPPLLPRLTQNNANTRNRIMLQQIFPRKYPCVGNQCKSIYMYSYLEIKNQVRLHTCSCWIYILMLFAIMKLICLGFPVIGFKKE